MDFQFITSCPSRKYSHDGEMAVIFLKLIKMVYNSHIFIVKVELDYQLDRLRAIKGITKLLFLVCLGKSWKCDLGDNIWYLTPLALYFMALLPTHYESTKFALPCHSIMIAVQ